jgi:hypothetical protein
LPLNKNSALPGQFGTAAAFLKIVPFRRNHALIAATEQHNTLARIAGS